MKKLVLILISLLLGMAFAATPCDKNPTSALCKTISQADHFIQVQAATPAPDLTQYTVASWDSTGTKVLKTTWTSTGREATAFVTPDRRSKDTDN